MEQWWAAKKEWDHTKVSRKYLSCVLCLWKVSSLLESSLDRGVGIFIVLENLSHYRFSIQK